MTPLVFRLALPLAATMGLMAIGACGVVDPSPATATSLGGAPAATVAPPLAAGIAATAAPALPRLAAAQPGERQFCRELVRVQQLPEGPGREALAALPGLSLASAQIEKAGALRISGRPVDEHCIVQGRIAVRQSAVDGQSYAISFQMRLPRTWNGRFFHQGNGGLDGFVTDATGAVSGAMPLTSALQQGFAVLSSDAGHTVRQLPLFGIDPQARLDYGYQAAAKLTPVARAVITAAYGRPPDRSYFGGCSNGGRHALVAAARQSGQYDGILAGNPGIRLPNAALAQLWGAQQWARLMPATPAGQAPAKDLGAAFSPSERRLLADRLLARCDTLDGAADGMVLDVAACQQAFNLARDVPSCDAQGQPAGACLREDLKATLARVYAGGRDGQDRPLYRGFPWDPGLVGADWANWKFVSSVTNRDPVAMAYVFQTPPAGPEAAKDPRAFALGFDVDRGLDLISASLSPYGESALSFMGLPPELADLAALRQRGGKVLAYHGTADAVFSAQDSVVWYQGLAKAPGAAGAQDFARLYLVPGMNHCRSGPATDQFDLLTPLVEWVEQGKPPQAVTARVRGNPRAAAAAASGSASSPPASANNQFVNGELPSGWSPDRSRPLCPWPQVARYGGQGDLELAEHFRCQ